MVQAKLSGPKQRICHRTDRGVLLLRLALYPGGCPAQTHPRFAYVSAEVEFGVVVAVESYKAIVGFAVVGVIDTAIDPFLRFGIVFKTRDQFQPYNRFISQGLVGV